MRYSLALVLFAAFAPHVEQVRTHDNQSPAGELRGGVLTVHLEVREAEWHPDRDSARGIVVRAFAEAGKTALVPGPLIRVAEGTEVHAVVRNPMSRGTLVIHGLSTRGTGRPAASDTIQIQPGATREVRFAAGAPGTYFYRGHVDGVANDASTMDAELSGVFIVDPRGASRARDRVFVIALWLKDSTNAGVIGRADVLRFTINGKSWPNTERLSYQLGDTVRFRLINASAAVHPMHLHGFYFNVESRGDAGIDSVYDRSVKPDPVVTERLSAGRTFAMSWVPDRAGNWLFHCHDNFHVLRNSPLDGTSLPAEHTLHVQNHALEMMGGLVMGIEVKERERATVVTQGSAARRQLRLVARADSGGTSAEPAYGYALSDGRATSRTQAPLLPGPTIVLKRGEPVSITVVNELREATAVHWHGIELESYYDGVADFAGMGLRIAPAIAPRDSFEARFTPPRSGTFIYHPHADEVRQQQAGMSGALIVVDDPARFDPTHDIVILLTVPRTAAEAANFTWINGSSAPAPLELRAGDRYRLRIVDIHTFRPSMIVRIDRDSTLARWRPLAKGRYGASRHACDRSARQTADGQWRDVRLRVHVDDRW
jgi:FtsP/CotA-like multicopper oxidase with cupredoxin domain